MRIVDQYVFEDDPTIKVRGFGFTWYSGVAVVIDLWHKRVSWSPWFIIRRGKHREGRN